MPNTQDLQARRREAIRALLGASPAATQQSLVSLLRDRGFDATQSSVSRDLKELGAVKTAEGYALVARESSGEEEITGVADLMRGLSRAGPHLLVIRTGIGAAQRVALALDRCGWPEIVGNIGGDDTVFTATASAESQRSLISKINRASERG